MKLFTRGGEELPAGVVNATEVERGVAEIPTDAALDLKNCSRFIAKGTSRWRRLPLLAAVQARAPGSPIALSRKDFATLFGQGEKGTRLVVRDRSIVDGLLSLFSLRGIEAIGPVLVATVAIFAGVLWPAPTPHDTDPVKQLLAGAVAEKAPDEGSLDRAGRVLAAAPAPAGSVEFDPDGPRGPLPRQAYVPSAQLSAAAARDAQARQDVAAARQSVTDATRVLAVNKADTRRQSRKSDHGVWLTRGFTLLVALLLAAKPVISVATGRA